jgi:hypothetical protein
VQRVAPGGGRVEIAEAVTAVNGELVWGPLKSHACRWVGVPDFVAQRLVQHIAGRDPDDLVFTSSLGEPLRASNFRRDAFDPAVREIGLDGSSHTVYATSRRASRLPPAPTSKSSSGMLGHRSATMTIDLYGHFFADRLHEVADALDRAARHSAQWATRADRGIEM